VNSLKIIAADSAAAILDDNFVPLTHIASVAVLVEPPYREAHKRIVDPIFKPVVASFEVIMS
jgi:hypothetical protein